MVEIINGPAKYETCEKCGIKRNVDEAPEKCAVCLFSKKKLVPRLDMNPMQQEVKRLYGFGIKQTEIGKRLGISKQRVHQILNIIGR